PHAGVPALHEERLEVGGLRVVTECLADGLDEGRFAGGLGAVQQEEDFLAHVARERVADGALQEVAILAARRERVERRFQPAVTSRKKRSQRSCWARGS